MHAMQLRPLSLLCGEVARNIAFLRFTMGWRVMLHETDRSVAQVVSMHSKERAATLMYLVAAR